MGKKMKLQELIEQESRVGVLPALEGVDDPVQTAAEGLSIKNKLRRRNFRGNLYKSIFSAAFFAGCLGLNVFTTNTTPSEYLSNHFEEKQSMPLEENRTGNEYYNMLHLLTLGGYLLSRNFLKNAYGLWRG